MPLFMFLPFIIWGGLWGMDVLPKAPSDLD